MAEGDGRENNGATITFLIKKREPVFTYRVSGCALANTSHQLVVSPIKQQPSGTSSFSVSPSVRPSVCPFSGLLLLEMTKTQSEACRKENDTKDAGVFDQSAPPTPSHPIPKPREFQGISRVFEGSSKS